MTVILVTSLAMLAGLALAVLQLRRLRAGVARLERVRSALRGVADPTGNTEPAE